MNTTDEAALREEFELYARREHRLKDKDFVRFRDGFRIESLSGHYKRFEVQWIWQAYLAASRSREWQPIDSAPKDGTRLLLWWPYWRADQPVVGRWFNHKWDSSCRLHDGGDNPTHWQPLPPAPTPESNEG